MIPGLGEGDKKAGAPGAGGILTPRARRASERPLSQPIPVIVCIDVEPDDRETTPDRPHPWAGYQALQRQLEALRPDLPGLAAPASYTWFLRMDPQIADTYGAAGWVATTYRAELDGALAHGDALGLHVHPFRRSAKASGWVSDFADQTWVDHCADVGLTAFLETWGRGCVDFRYGDGWMNDATLARLETRGIRHDLTLEPGKHLPSGLRPGPAWIGRAPDLRSMPTAPYRPDLGDFRRPDHARTDGLWIVPVTTGRLRPSLGLVRKAYRAVLRRGWITPETLVLNPALIPQLFDDLLDQALTRVGPSPLVLTVRSDVGLRRRQLRNVSRNLTRLGRASRAVGFCTPAAALAALGLAPRSDVAVRSLAAGRAAP
jgi:hypothetical protein